MRAKSEMARVLARYESGGMGRRELFRALNRLLGGYAAVHLFLESSGIAPSLLAQESQKVNVDSETVHYKGPAGPLEAYLARPKSGAPGDSRDA